jgi:hypothetical protein
MADKQRGTGASGKQQKAKGQNQSEYGNHSRSTTNNRSQQKKAFNRSDAKPSERSDRDAR